MYDHLLAQLTGRRPRCYDLPPRAHLIGLAGAGMQALAEVLLDHQWRLSGSDREIDSLRKSVASAARIHAGHDPCHVSGDCDLVIHSAAVPADNVERRRAAQCAIPLLSYPRALARIANAGRALAIAGTHGKSTAVAMTDEVLRAAGLDPTVIGGGVVLGHETGGRAGRDNLALIEACEYRRHFLRLRPAAAVILGVELDHVDCYHSTDELQKAFAQFAGRVQQDGLLIARYDCRNTQAALAAARCRYETFGIDTAADWSADDLRHDAGRWSFQLLHRGRPHGRVKLRVAGRHNVCNALAAAALGHWCGAGYGDIVSALDLFPGLKRRLESIGTIDGIAWIDDYAHHPTAVAAALAAVRQLHRGCRVWCVFQPHQVSRTRRLLDELAESLQNADKIVVAEIFRAREPWSNPGDVSALDLAAAVRRRGGDVAEVHEIADIAEHLRKKLATGDVVVTMGAGDIWKLRHELVGRLRTICAAG